MSGRHVGAVMKAGPALAAMLVGCAGLPWGEGGAEPTRATAGAVVRTFDQHLLELAAERLALGVASRLPEGLELQETTDTATIDWQDWSVAVGAPRIELPPLQLTMTAARPGASLLVQVPLSAAEHEIELTFPAFDGHCRVTVAALAGELTVPMSFATDKLGRVQGVTLAGATFRRVSPNGVNAMLADWSSCLALDDATTPLDVIDGAFASAAVEALREALSAELSGALGLDLAFGWSAPVSADALGTGLTRVALRAIETGLMRREGSTLQVAFALTMEADAHPCMGRQALSAPRAELALAELPAGVALHLEALERIVDAEWLAGAACADHLGTIALPIGPSIETWPELARLPATAELGLELWPMALPRVMADPGMVDGLTLETGRMRVDLIVTFGGARWRAASVELELSLHGSLWVDDDGAVFFDPAAVEARPTLLEAGLIGAPNADAVPLLVGSLVEALVVDLPLGHLPPALRPPAGQSLRVEDGYLTWPSWQGQQR